VIKQIRDQMIISDKSNGSLPLILLCIYKVFESLYLKINKEKKY